MSDLVDARAPRLVRMALTNCDQDKCGPQRLSVNAENGPPLPIRLWDVVLYAAAKTRPIACFGIAWA